MPKRLVEWKIGLSIKYMAVLKKLGKYIREHLADKNFKAFLSSPATAEIDQALEAIINMCKMFE